MNQESYLAQRVDNQIDWYDRKSQRAQRHFKLLRGFEIVAATAIPVVAGFAQEPFPVALVVGILGASIAITSGLIGLNQYQENWIDYRAQCEALRHEKYLFLTGVGRYQKGEPFPRFVQQIESLLASENSAWSQATRSAMQESQPSIPPASP